MQLASRFGRFSTGTRSNQPLTNDEIARVAPSIFAREAHESRSDRYTYIPTITVLDGLRKEGFEPYRRCRRACAMKASASTRSTWCGCAMPITRSPSANR